MMINRLVNKMASKMTLVVIAVVAVCIAGGAAAFLLMQDKGYEVEYELDGGHFYGDFPKTYKPGHTFDIPTPIKDDYVSAGFYTDPELTQYFDGDTSGMEGPLKLYARWLESPVGHYAMYTVVGECDRGMSSYTLEGYQTKIFYYNSSWTGMLCTWMAGVNTYTYTEAHERYDKIVSIMQETPGYVNCKYLGTETIDTSVGQKVCEVYTTTYDNGAVGTVWIEGWIPYKETYDYVGDLESSIEREHIEYIYEMSGEVEIPQEGTLALYRGDGITVPNYKEEYDYGEMVTLTAEVQKGKTFGGWYDGQYNLLTKDRSYTFEYYQGGVAALYALNSSEEMIHLEKGVEVNLEELFGYKDAIYSLYDCDTRHISGLDTVYTFPKGGQYRIDIVEKNDLDRHSYEVLVSGGVQREYSWSWNGKNYKVSLEIEYDDIRYVNQYYDVSERRQDKPNHERDASFVTLSYEDKRMAPYTEKIVDLLINAYMEKNSKMDEKDYLNYLLAFTQYIPYQTDEEFLGTSEYWKFPLETLFDNGGDCEDTSILFVAIAHESMKKLGFDYGIALQVLPKHVSVAVKTPLISGKTNPYGYLYGETTAKNYKIGDIPEVVKDSFLDEAYYTKRSFTVEIQ